MEEFQVVKVNAWFSSWETCKILAKSWSESKVPASIMPRYTYFSSEIGIPRNQRMAGLKAWGREGLQSVWLLILSSYITLAKPMWLKIWKIYKMNRRTFFLPFTKEEAIFSTVFKGLNGSFHCWICPWLQRTSSRSNIGKVTAIYIWTFTFAQIRF